MMADNLDVKWIQVYKNGDPYSPPVKFVVYRKYCRNFESLLNSLTFRLKPSFGAVRNLYTPDNGTKIEKLEDIQPNEKYVAAGTEKFRSISYESIGNNPVRLRSRNFFLEASKRRLVMAFSPGNILKKIRTSIDNALIQPVIHSRIKAPSRYRKEVENSDALTIFVYRNGNDIAPAHVVALSKKDMRTWEVMLQRISERVLPSPYGFVRRLYTLQGNQLHSFSELQNGYSYVAVVGHENFRRIAYGMLSPPQSRKFSPWKHTESVTRFQPVLQNSTPIIQQPSYIKDPNSERSGRMHRTLLTERERQKGIFTVKDQNSRSPSNIKQVDYDQDISGVYRAKSQDPLIADEIRDSKETVVELPLDDRPAEEVRAEEIQTTPQRKRRFDLQANVEDSCSGVMPASEPSIEVELDDLGNIISLNPATSNPCLHVCTAGGLPTSGSLTWRETGLAPPLQLPDKLEITEPIPSVAPLKTNRLNSEKYSAWSNDIRDLKKRLMSNLSSSEESQTTGTTLHASPDFCLQKGSPTVIEEFCKRSPKSRLQPVSKYIHKSPRNERHGINTTGSLTARPADSARSCSADKNDVKKAETSRVESVRSRLLPRVESVSTFETARDDFLLDTARGGQAPDELPLVFITARERSSSQKLLLSIDDQSCGDKLMPEDSLALSSSSMCISPNSELYDINDVSGRFARYPSPVTSDDMKDYHDRFEEKTSHEGDSSGCSTERRKTLTEVGIIPKLGQFPNLLNDTSQRFLDTPRASTKCFSCRTPCDSGSRSNDASPTNTNTPRLSVKSYSCRTLSETELPSAVSTPSSSNTPRTSVKSQSCRTQLEMDMLLSKGQINDEFSRPASECSDSFGYSPMVLCKTFPTISPNKSVRTQDSDQGTTLINGEINSPSWSQSARSTDPNRLLRKTYTAGSPIRVNELSPVTSPSPPKGSGGTLKVKVDLKSRRYSVFKVPATQFPTQTFEPEELIGSSILNGQGANCDTSDTVNKNLNREKIVPS